MLKLTFGHLRLLGRSRWWLLGQSADEAKFAERLAGCSHALAAGWWLFGGKFWATSVKITLVFVKVHVR
jgi:hypothetical protein